MFNKKKMLPLVIFPILLITCGFVQNGWSQSGDSADSNENEIMLAHNFGKVTLLPANDHLQPTSPMRPGQLQKQIIVVNAERFSVTPQTTFLDTAGDAVDDRTKVQEGEMISFSYNEMTNEIFELRLEDLNTNIDKEVYANDIKETCKDTSPKPKQTIIFENGVYRNVPEK